MKRVLHLFVPSLTGCLLVASLLSSCTSVHGPTSVPAVDGLQSDTSGAEPLSPSRVQIGMASWYGRPFHGRPTASGEIYDMYQATAAHLTAPLGTHAVVTNLENGQTVRVRINDRGPHKRNRILDLSYSAAQQLDMVRPGSARVKVEFLQDAPAPAQLAATPRDAAPEPPHAGPAAPLPAVRPFVIQVGAYHDHHNAMRAHQTLTTVYPNVWIAMTPESWQPLHRVRLGPFQNRQEVDRVVREVRARGYAAVIIALPRQG